MMQTPLHALRGWRGNCDIKILLCDCHEGEPTPEEDIAEAVVADCVVRNKWVARVEENTLEMQLAPGDTPEAVLENWCKKIHKTVKAGVDDSKRRGRMKNLKMLCALTFSCRVQPCKWHCLISKRRKLDFPHHRAAISRCKNLTEHKSNFDTSKAHTHLCSTCDRREM